MFDKLIDVLLQFLDLFRFWEVLNEYERGVILRFGRFQREVGPGLHGLLPFGIDRALTDNVVVRTDQTGNMTLTLTDGTPVAVSGVVRYNIRDVKKALLEVEGIDHVMRDCVLANLSDAVRRSTWEELKEVSFSDSLTRQCRKQAWRYGVEIESVQLSDLARTHPVSLVSS